MEEKEKKKREKEDELKKKQEAIAKMKEEKEKKEKETAKKRSAWNTKSKYIFSKWSSWSGGSESECFSKLEEIAASMDPKTPTLGCKMNESLVANNDKLNMFSRTRVNWVVQSSGVDYLHLLLVSMRWLIDSHNLSHKIRFCISIHDEIRFISSDDTVDFTCLALQISNLLTRSLFVAKLNMNDLPNSVAYFSLVDVDHVLRKETNLNCLTPSNSQPIPNGRSLSIYEIVQKTNGSMRNSLKQ